MTFVRLQVFNTEKGLEDFLTTVKVFNIQKGLHHFLITRKVFDTKFFTFSFHQTLLS